MTYEEWKTAIEGSNIRYNKRVTEFNIAIEMLENKNSPLYNTHNILVMGCDDDGYRCMVTDSNAKLVIDTYYSDINHLKLKRNEYVSEVVNDTSLDMYNKVKTLFYKTKALREEERTLSRAYYTYRETTPLVRRTDVASSESVETPEAIEV